MAGVLRIFLRYAASQGWCNPRLAQVIRGPRIYKEESLPFAPDWADVQRILAETSTDDPRDVRDRAILMLLSIYGMRASEVASLRLDQVDWQQHVIRMSRLQKAATAGVSAVAISCGSVSSLHRHHPPINIPPRSVHWSELATSPTYARRHLHHCQPKVSSAWNRGRPSRTARIALRLCDAPYCRRIEPQRDRRPSRPPQHIGHTYVREG